MDYGGEEEYQSLSDSLFRMWDNAFTCLLTMYSGFASHAQCMFENLVQMSACYDLTSIGNLVAWRLLLRP